MMSFQKRGATALAIALVACGILAPASQAGPADLPANEFLDLSTTCYPKIYVGDPYVIQPDRYDPAMAANNVRITGGCQGWRYRVDMLYSYGAIGASYPSLALPTSGVNHTYTQPCRGSTSYWAEVTVTKRGQSPHTVSSDHLWLNCPKSSASVTIG